MTDSRPTTHRDEEILRRVALVRRHGVDAWLPWSTGERLAVALVLRSDEILDETAYTYSEALDRWRAELGLADRDVAEAWVQGLRERAGVL